MLGEKLELNDIPFVFQEHTTMSKVIEPSKVLPVSQVSEPQGGRDLLTEILRKGARELLAHAVEQEVQEWLGERSGRVGRTRPEAGRSQRASAGADDSHGDWPRRGASTAGT